MPARDPAITPHHPSLGSSVSSAPGLPLHRRSDGEHAPPTPNPNYEFGGAGSHASSGPFGIGALASRRMSNSGSQYEAAGPRRGSLWQAVTGRKGDSDSMSSGYARMPAGEESDGSGVHLRGDPEQGWVARAFQRHCIRADDLAPQPALRDYEEHSR